MQELTNKMATGETSFRMPQYKDWDKLLDIVGDADVLTHWKTASFWEDSIEELHPDLAKEDACALRGHISARDWYYDSSSNVYANRGFRPALEVLDTEILNPDNLKPGDSLQRYALYLDGVEQLIPKDPVNHKQIPQFKAGQRIEFKEATCPESTITWLYNGECFIADRTLLTYVSFDELENQGFVKKQPITFKIKNTQNLLVDELKEILIQENPDVFTRLYDTVHSEVSGEARDPIRAGEHLIEAFLARDVNAFCVALTGWKFTDILKKAGTIEDDEGVFCN